MCQHLHVHRAFDMLNQRFVGSNGENLLSASKLVSLAEAIRREITDGASVALGTAQETAIPFAAGHEIIRQGKRELTLIGPISDILFDQMVGAGCVRCIQAAWVGNVITGSGYNFRRALESDRISVEDHSILTLTAGLTAGKMGVPFMPAFTALGSDLHQTNPNLTTTACPFTRQRLTAVRAIHPDVTVVQVQRADEEGGFHFWGNLGVTREACLAAKTVLVCAEEIVPSAVIRSDPNRSLIPSFRVRAVCHVPWGGHPSPVPGYYNRDHRAFLEYRDESRTEADYLHWKQHWIDAVPTRDAYLQRLGSKRMAALALKEHVYSEPVDYGY